MKQSSWAMSDGHLLRGDHDRGDRVDYVRVGNYQYSYQYGVLLDQLWVR